MEILARCDSIGAMPPAAQALFDDPGGRHLFTSRPWFETFVSVGLGQGAQPLFLILGDGKSPSAILPCERPSGGNAALTGLTSFYSCDFRPLVAPGANPWATAFALGRAVSEEFRRDPVIGFDSLDIAQEETAAFLAGLARPGRTLLRYAHFGRWWEDVAGRAFADYMAARDGALREVVRRKGAKLERDGATLTMIGADASADAVERGIADYETVYAASWKEPEPFPDFQPRLMRNLARAGWLRLALCHVDGRPIAAQLWTLIGGAATVLKLAHDQAFDKHSPGTVLTHFAIGRLMESETIRRLDFGRGDDPYKAGWTINRTQHFGVLSVDIVKRPALVVRHWLGALLRKLHG
jgi:Acetyltransferase (GNAT) domain